MTTRLEKWKANQKTQDFWAKKLTANQSGLSPRQARPQPIAQDGEGQPSRETDQQSQ